MNREAFTTTEYFGVFRRRRGVLVAVTVAGIILTLGLAFKLPAIYRSTGTILVEQQEIPSDIVRSTVTSYADERIQVIGQRVMAREQLAKIIAKHGLVADPDNTEQMNQAVEDLRAATLTEMIDARVNNERTGKVAFATIAFTVSYDNGDPVLARDVAQDLVNLYLEQNQLERQRTATETTQFLGSEAGRLQAELAEAEAALAEFKRRNAGKLPQSQSLVLQRLDRAQQEADQLTREIRTVQQERQLIEAQLRHTPAHISVAYDDSGEPLPEGISRLQQLQAEYMRLSSIYSPDHPDLARLRKELRMLSGGDMSATRAQLEASLAQQRAELQTALERYSADHPDVARLRRSVESLEKELATSALLTPSQPTEPTNPDYVQLQVRLRAARENAAALEVRRQSLLDEIAAYEQRLDQIPGVERELQALTREVELANARYNELREQQTQARLAQTMETESKGERFTIIDPPRIALQPVKPNRPALISLGIVLSLALGVGLVALVEALDRSVRSSRDVLNILEIHPVGMVPIIENASDIRRRVLRRTVAATAAIVVTAVLVI